MNSSGVLDEEDVGRDCTTICLFFLTFLKSPCKSDDFDGTSSGGWLACIPPLENARFARKRFCLAMNL